MEAIKKTRGRPKKADTEGTPAQVKKRQYMRKYVGEIKAGISQLEQDEKDCLAHLENIRQERSKLIDMIEAANKQAADIMESTLRPPVKKSNPKPISMPKPKPKKIMKPVSMPKPVSDEIIFQYLKDESAPVLQAAVRRKLAKK